MYTYVCPVYVFGLSLQKLPSATMWSKNIFCTSLYLEYFAMYLMSKIVISFSDLSLSKKLKIGY